MITQIRQEDHVDKCNKIMILTVFFYYSLIFSNMHPVTVCPGNFVMRSYMCNFQQNNFSETQSNFLSYLKIM